jgi:hypothetical protein
MLDVFADTLFSFKPFEIVRNARRLLAPGAAAVPMRVSLHAALADFRRWHRMVPGQVAGMDFAPLIGLSPRSVALDVADPGLTLRSESVPMVAAALPDDLPPDSGSSTQVLTSSGGRVNGVAIWLCLDLTPNHTLEARPGTAPEGFYARPAFHAFAEALETTPGTPCAIRLAWKGKTVRVGRPAP